eukprot:3912071-Pleurochrysis_carterae.AAC.1
MQRSRYIEVCRRSFCELCISIAVGSTGQRDREMRSRLPPGRVNQSVGSISADLSGAHPCYKKFYAMRKSPHREAIRTSDSHEPTANLRPRKHLSVRDHSTTPWQFRRPIVKQKKLHARCSDKRSRTSGRPHKYALAYVHASRRGRASCLRRLVRMLVRMSDLGEDERLRSRSSRTPVRATHSEGNAWRERPLRRSFNLRNTMSKRARK